MTSDNHSDTSQYHTEYRRQDHISEFELPMRRQRRRRFVIIMLLVVVLGAAAGYGYHQLMRNPYAARDTQDRVFRRVTFADGATPQQIGDELQKQKIITKSADFYKYAQSNGAEKLKSGTYLLSPSQDMTLIFEQIAAGPGTAPKVAKGNILFRPGNTPGQIGQKIENETHNKITSDDFSTALTNKTFVNKMITKYPKLLKGCDVNQLSEDTLTGYVFPAAYKVDDFKSAESVIDDMLKVSDQTLTPYYKTFDDNGLQPSKMIPVISQSGKDVFEQRLAFITKIAPYAQQMQKEHGVLASINIAQAAHESNWDNSDLSSKYHNFYGVKSEDEANSVLLDTTEHENGKDVTVKARFAVYKDWQHSMLEHTQLFVKGTDWNPNQYKDVLKAKDYQAAAKALYDDRYATDPQYTKVVTELIETWNLNRYDK